MSSQLSPASGFERLRRIESSKVFQGAVITIIILSALTIGAKTYDLPPLVEKSLIVMDNAITLFFLVEILFRFGVCANKKRFLFDGWNLFDTLVVIGSLIPLDNSEAVLLGRLLRVFRVATFEDWTDVMYATMEQYPLSWIFYLTFIFLTAFVFLNMMIGAILEVMGEEQNAKQAQKAHDERDEIARQLQAVQVQLAELTKQVSEKR